MMAFDMQPEVQKSAPDAQEYAAWCFEVEVLNRFIERFGRTVTPENIDRFVDEVRWILHKHGQRKNPT